MKNTTIFQKLLVIIVIVTMVPLVSFSQNSNSFQRLTQINKKFLVVVHIVEDSTKRPAIDANVIRNSVAGLNNIFQPIGATFEVCDVRNITNYSYFTINKDLTQELFVKYSVPDRLNLFVVGSLFGAPVSPCGVASLGGSSRERNVGVVVGSGSCAGESTLAHEFGHFFSLEHTFEKSNGLELADGSNCAVAGDKLCDTPADPYFEGAVMSDYIQDCLFVYNGKDVNGNYYDPDIGNVMSYYSCKCTKFTRSQYDKMAKYYLSNPLLW